MGSNKFSEGVFHGGSLATLILLSTYRLDYHAVMSITTTRIGAYPKPGCVDIGNFAETGTDDGATRVFSCTNDDTARVDEALLLCAIEEAAI